MNISLKTSYKLHKFIQRFVQSSFATSSNDAVLRREEVREVTRWDEVVQEEAVIQRRQTETRIAIWRPFQRWGTSTYLLIRLPITKNNLKLWKSTCQ